MINYERVSSQADSFRSGSDKVWVAILGVPNAGKSTLLNALVGDERAIVSDITGTTRDVVKTLVSLKEHFSGLLILLA